MKVGHVTERTTEGGQGPGHGQLDTDEMDRAGIDLGPTGRLQLMAKLAEGKKMLIKSLSSFSFSPSLLIKEFRTF